jgi:type IV pilus assembly protein PilA
MTRLNERRAADLDGEAVDAGFTLIELMVVLLILAILLAIAIPTFLGVTNSANDRASQSNLNTSLTDAKSIYESNSQSYPSSTVLQASLSTNEPSLASSLTTQVTALTAGQIALYPSADGNGVVIITLAQKTNECWIIADNTSTVVDATTAANGNPYTAGAPGMPKTPGEYYGVYKATTVATATCALANVAGNLTAANTKTAGFPPAA